MRLALLLTTVPCVALADPALTEALKTVSGKKVFFAHQSVGDNVLEGLQTLAREAQVPFRIVEGNGPDLFATHAIAHAHVGKNEDPKSKLEDFERRLDGPAGGAQVALLKFCYVDFSAGTDSQALFDAYLSRVEAVRKKHPGLTVVHVTAPLTAVQTGVKGWLKNTLGRPASGELENVARETYNQLLRARFLGQEPIFDLAALEAGQGATACSFTRDGKRWPCMRPELTDDGGHLNARGQREAATLLVKTLAAVP